MKDKFLDAKGLGHFWKRIVEYIKGTTPTKVSQLENDSHYMTNGVTSFNGSVGDIVYSQDVTSVNGKKGNITLRTSDLANDSGYITTYTETDPTVPAWAKQSTKPSYTAQEVGALPDSTVIPEGIPAGGTTGQVLRKTSDADYAVEWHDEEGGGGGGVQSDWNQSDSTKLDYIKNKPTIPAEVTETTVAGWGFTKNTGTYSKPSTGIPSTDLASSVQTSLGKADTAYQKPDTGIPSTDLSSDVQTSLGKAATAIQTETDPTVPSWAKAESKPSYTASEVGAVPTTRTVNGKALSVDITLTASDVSALPSSTTIPTITFRQW